MDLKEIGEFGLIDRIKAGTRQQDGIVCGTGEPDRAIRGIGDDCAVIPQRSGKDTLVSTDMLVEGTHFLMGDITPYQLGWKSAAVNLSDIAAMGGKPTAAFLAFALTDSVDTLWTDAFMDGFRCCCDSCGTPLLGGDTTSSKCGLSICVTVLGECGSGNARLRSVAKPGDLVCVTGNLGDSAGGLEVILRGLERTGAAKVLVDRHYHPVPRVTEGLSLASCSGVHAMMDISDGIASDLLHILDESRVSARIDVAKVPQSNELQELWPEKALDLALCGGEDYELLFTVEPAFEPLVSIPHFVIGVIENGAPGTAVWEGLKKNICGFRHF